MSAQRHQDGSHNGSSIESRKRLAQSIDSLVDSFRDWMKERPEAVQNVAAICRQILNEIETGENSQACSESAGSSLHCNRVDVDLELIIERCRLKAEGARWAVERVRLIDNGADFHTEVRPTDHQVIQRARDLPNCFLWMNQPRDDIRRQRGDFLQAALCFDAMAETLDVLLATLESDDNERFLATVDLVAEAQSALRTIVSRVEDYPDSDQQQVYHWLRNRANSYQFYSSRYKLISDPADPRNAHDVIEKAGNIRSELPRTERISILKRNPLMIVQARLDRLHPDPAQCTVEQWDDVFDALDEALEAGISFDSPDLRQLLLPRFEDIPDMEVSEQTDAVLLEIERYVDNLPSERRSA